MFDGPGIEGRPTLDAAAVAAVDPDRLADVRLTPAPCLRILAFRFPVHTYFTAVRRGEEVALPEPNETFLAVTRQRYVVRHFELSRPAHDLLAGLLRGQALGAAIGAVATGENADELERRLVAWFADWAAQGFFLDIAPGTE